MTKASDWLKSNCRFAIAMPASVYEMLLQALSAKAHHARMRLKTQPPQFQDFVDVAAEMIGKHGVTFEEFCERITKEFGLHGLRTAQVAPGGPPPTQHIVEKPNNLEEIYTHARQQFVKHVPNEAAVNTARQYAASVGLPEPKPHGYAKVDPERAKRIAAAYEQMQDNPIDPEVQAAYAALRNEIHAQYAMLPVTIEPIGPTEANHVGAKYRHSCEMMQDVMDNKHLWVFDGGDEHPLLSREDNFKLRAVHDYFGHAMFGYEFGPRGEENAWIEHSKMFTPLARKALTSETRGQSSWVNFGPHSHLPPAQRPYAIQKAGLLPEEFHSHEAIA